jgi:hypothetical protein
MSPLDWSNTQIQAFRDTVDICELLDLGFEGNPWTFEKRVTGGSFCRVQLDRALVTASWCSRFPLVVLKHLTGVASDHSSIFLRFVPQLPAPVHRVFRYEAMWEDHKVF